MNTQTTTQIKTKKIANLIDIKDLFTQDIKSIEHLKQKELLEAKPKNKNITMKFIEQSNQEDAYFDQILQSQEIKNTFKKLGNLVKKKYGANNNC